MLKKFRKLLNTSKKRQNFSSNVNDHADDDDEKNSVLVEERSLDLLTEARMIERISLMFSISQNLMNNVCLKKL